jgi:hypothetical protein
MKFAIFFGLALHILYVILLGRPSIFYNTTRWVQHTYFTIFLGGLTTSNTLSLGCPTCLHIQYVILSSGPITSNTSNIPYTWVGPPNPVCNVTSSAHLAGFAICHITRWTNNALCLISWVIPYSTYG